MIPPFLVSKAASLFAPIATKLSSPLAKWGFIVVILLGTNFYTWHRTTLECEQEQRIAAEEQAKAQAAQDAKVIADRETIYRELNETKLLSNQRITDLKKRMAIYERNAKLANIPAPPDSHGMFNAISGLFPPLNQLPGASPTGKSDESSEARIEITRLLLAYVNAYGHCGEELTSLWDDYSALVKAIRSQSVIEKG